MSTSNNPSPLLKVITALLVIGAVLLGLKTCHDNRERERERERIQMFFQQLNEALKDEK